MAYASWWFDPTAIVILCVTFILAIASWDTWRFRALPPGPRPFPFLGNVFITWPKSFFLIHRTGLAKQYGPICTVYHGRTPTIICSTPEMVQEVLVKNGSVFVERPNHLFTFKLLSSDHEMEGVVFSNGECWKKSRKFTTRLMKDMGAVQKHLEEMILEENRLMSDDLLALKQTPTDPFPYLQRAVSNIVSTIIYGSRFEYDDPNFKNLLFVIETMFTADMRMDPLCPMNFNQLLQLLFLIGQKVSNKSSRFLKSFETFREYNAQAIEDHRSSFDQNHIRNFIDLFLQMENGDGDHVFTVNGLQKTIFDLYFAGTDTTSHTLEWALLYMIAYPDVQRKCADEISKVVGFERAITMADRDKLPYLLATLTETQRMSPVAPITLPHQAVSDVTISGYLIPKGAIVLGDIMSCLRDPKYWNEPDTFMPEHFLDDQGSYKQNKAFIPFSTGPRMCIGDTMAKTEMFLFFANLLQRFEFSKISEDQQLDLSGYVLFTYNPHKYELICKPRNG